MYQLFYRFLFRTDIIAWARNPADLFHRCLIFFAGGLFMLITVEASCMLLS